MSVRDVVIVGAGPSGLSAAIAARRESLDYEVIEQGTLVNSIYRFPPQMVFFTTPELLEIGGLPFVSPYDKPTRAEALRYYRKVVDTFDLVIAYDEKVTSVRAEKPDAEQQTRFAVETQSTRSAGARRVRHARHVVFAIGYYDHPNLLHVPGENLPHVHHYYGEPHPYYRKRVVIVGGGNSAAESALEMHRAGANVTLVHRAPAMKSTLKYWVRPDIENRIKEGSITAYFDTCVTAITPTAVEVAPATPCPQSQRADERDQRGNGPQRRGPLAIPADAVFLLTGYRADSDLMVGAGVQLNDREAPRCDPLTFETNVPGLFVAGGAIAGVDTGTVFIENGRFHGEKIVDAIARRVNRRG